jgi:hypothetical protein
MPTSTGKIYLGSVLVSGGGEPSSEWVRPADWLPITEVGASEQKFIGLMAITNDDSNFAALSASGAYTVDWGDGTTTDHATGTTALKLYDYSAISNDTLSERGYKQVVVTVTPQAGQNLTALNLNVRHTQAGLQAYETGWLDIEVGSPNFSGGGLIIAGAAETVRRRMAERVRIANLGSQTTMANLFLNMSALFVANISGTSSVTNMNNTFRNCVNLVSVNLFDTGLVTNMVSAFDGSGVRTVPLFNTVSVTSMASMFSGCVRLISIPLFNTTSVTQMSSMFISCVSLRTVSALTTTSVPSGGFNSMFTACNSLARIEAKNFNFTFSVASCKLSAAALDEIYANLPTVTGQTITVTGNWGTAAHTPSIATAKGWTVTV